MMRPAILLCLLAAAAASAEGREPVAVPWTEHPVLSLPTPLLAVSDRDTTDGSATADFFARLTDLGFTCLAFGPPRRRIRRTKVVCTRGDGGGEWFGYAGGWPKGGSVFIVDRVRVGRDGSAELLGGAHVGAHVREVLGPAESPRPVLTVQDTAVR